MDMVGDAMGQYIGWNPIANKIGLPTGTLVILGSSIAAKIAGKYANPQIKKIPLIGSYMKM